ncbi:STAS domain-containing protein [Actinomadura sp. ATCC 31491]|uniref:STAS domain-containing protein n=1 Tax=Actinomadura luzonensis TaxID=2805427 RepID=A0ABT0FVZ6_9ACTN|nr:STAS domain-containing protein [Actinomadura luzonensis]MCK2216490.1 STAS domain-containing protein [Actinomadura luzonensis]
MTAFVPDPLTLALATLHPGALRVAVDGDLDFTTAEDLLTTAVAALDGGRLTDLHLDCGGLRICDSSGLAALLMIHRHATAAGTRLHLERRPPVLERMLHVSGTYEHLTGAPAAASRHSSTQD